MKRLCVSVVVLALALPGLNRAADEPVTVLTAHGIVSKVDVKKNALVVQPVGQDGKFGKPIELTLTGTSKVFMVETQKTGDKVVLRQRSIEPGDLKPKQHVTITYGKLKNEMVLLYTAALPME
jgi:hypothetical protein